MLKVAVKTGREADPSYKRPEPEQPAGEAPAASAGFAGELQIRLWLHMLSAESLTPARPHLQIAVQCGACLVQQHNSSRPVSAAGPHMPGGQRDEQKPASCSRLVPRCRALLQAEELSSMLRVG